MTPRENAGRADLAAWKDASETNYYDATPNLGHVLQLHMNTGRFAQIEPRLREFGATVATVVDPAVEVLERRRELPALDSFDGVGRRTERIEFHPAYHDAGRAIWRSGILAFAAKPGRAAEQTALFYLLSHAGEGGHACPVACTAGLIRALQAHGSPQLQERFLPRLLETHYAHADRGSQFLTEVQGGSDVGANLAEATQDADGAWRISGEKWFCSVADADQFLITARPAGAAADTRGLGCFVVPRMVDGEPNGFRIRRLKDKLGTRAMASAEIDFDGALAFPIGPIDEGFHIAVGVVLNTSRWLNAAGSTGLMRRAVLEASRYARHRRAFGRPIGDFSLVKEQLAVMTVEEQAALASTMELAALVDRIDVDIADFDDVAFHRVLVNANKYVTSIAATDVVHRAIEVLGGNGTIEEFSCLPRLYRDAIVFESWEGTHNVLCEQVRRDMSRLDLLDPVIGRLRTHLGALTASEDVAAVTTAVDELEPALRNAVDDADGSVRFRWLLGRLTRSIQAACLLKEAEAEAGAAVSSSKADVAAFFIRRHVVAGYDPARDPRYLERIDAVLGATSTTSQHA